MIRTTHALLGVIFLCGLEETVLSQIGHCAGNQCFALFQEPKDFSGAKESCKKTGGQLLVSSLDQTKTTLASVTSGISGSYWLSSTNVITEEPAAGRQLCSSIYVTMKSDFNLVWTTCSDILDGFVCHYTFDEPCSILHADGGAQVRYTAHEGFEVNDSESFPPGTTAVVQKVVGEYPDSEHLCFSRNWLQAPWKCEVMKGGCEHSCNKTTDTCICPAKQTLHPNNISCIKHPDSFVSKCTKGYRLAQDRKSCVDVDECKEEEQCTGEGEECVNTQGAFECRCKEGFDDDDGVCVDVAICEKCEHMKCNKYNGVYRCECRNGFRVSPIDTTKCEQQCTERDCLATCIPNPDVEKDMLQCFCPEGYIQDMRNNTHYCTDIDECELPKQCDHKCENLFGGFKCLCDEGYELQDDHKCVSNDIDENEDGSGSSPSYPPPASAHPAAVPSYVKTGSVLGITVFILLCAALLYFLVQHTAKRCGKFELCSLKGQDIFNLQQVTTDTYKRLSFDKQLKNDGKEFNNTSEDIQPSSHVLCTVPFPQNRQIHTWDVFTQLSRGSVNAVEGNGLSLKAAITEDMCL